VRALLLYPQFPKTFWSFETALDLIERKALVAPLGLPTVAALLPQDWEFKLVDRNVRPATEAEWAWADVVLLSAMLVQRPDFLGQIREAKRRGKCVVVGGPYPTSVPDDAEVAGADYLVLDEGELTIPPFLEAFRRRGGRGRQPGEAALVFRAGGDKPDITATPRPALRPARLRRLRHGGGPVLARLPVPVRVLRHHQPVRAAAAHQDPRSAAGGAGPPSWTRLAAQRVPG
jgi:radical SAM superfamily enzyme YgiQ (UPF0313 family)